MFFTWTEPDAARRVGARGGACWRAVHTVYVLTKVARATSPRGPRRDITVVDPPGSRFCEVMSHLRTHLLKGKTHLSHYRAVSSGGDVPGETHLGSREMR